MAQHPGMARLRVLTERGAWVNVGPFPTLPAASRFAHDLAQERVAVVVRVEHKNRGTWRPAWTWRGAALVGVLVMIVGLTGCAPAATSPGSMYHLPAPGRGAAALCNGSRSVILTSAPLRAMSC